IPGQTAASGTGEGEITRMFRAQARDADVQGEPTGSESAGEASVFATPEGEFTGTLRGPAHAPLADTPTAPPESGAHPETGTGGGDAPLSQAPGEFTRMLGAVSPQGPPAAASPRMVPPAPDPRAGGSP